MKPMMEGVPCGADLCSSACQAPPPSLQEILARFEREGRRGTCDTGRYRCPYFVWGEGPPLLCIPGLADDSHSFVQMIARLTGRFRCIAYDLPSGGGDGARLTRYHHHDLVEDALALLDYLGIRCSYLFGSSFGSTIALAAMRLYPDRLRRALVQGGFARRPLARMEHLMASLVRFWPGSMRIMPLRAATLRRVNGPLFAGKPPEAWDYFMERSNAHSIAAVAHRALMVHHLDLQPILPEIRQPILLICGDSDPLVSRHCDDALLEGLPNARRLELFNCGHNPLFTHPEILAEVVTRFLTPPPDSQPR